MSAPAFSKIHVPSLYLFTFLLTFVVYLLKIDTLYLETDSPEFIAAAMTLGIPHAPGYPLYTMIAHLFTQLPFESVSYAVTFFSAISLALSAPLLMYGVQYFVSDAVISASVTLAVMFSFYIWSVGIVAEVYAPQLLMLSFTAATLIYLTKQAQPKLWHCMVVGASYGLAIGMAPSSATLALGVLFVFLQSKQLSWGQRIAGGVTSLIVFGLCLLYFPFAYQAQPELNVAGSYNRDGVFETVDLTTVEGVWWLISGEQFEDNFFEEGVLVTPDRLLQTGNWFLANFYSVGLVLSLVGLVLMMGKMRGKFLVWLSLFLPYTYFFMTYGAGDRQTMFGPSYFLLAVPFAVGIQWILSGLPRSAYGLAVILLPVVFLTLTAGYIDSNDAFIIKEQSEQYLAEIPDDAVVFGDWVETMPLRYHQIVNETRLDIDVYTLFFFDYEQERVQSFLDHLLAQDKTVVFLGRSEEDLLDTTQYWFLNRPTPDDIQIVEVKSLD